MLLLLLLLFLRQKCQQLVDYNVPVSTRLFVRFRDLQLLDYIRYTPVIFGSCSCGGSFLLLKSKVCIMMRQSLRLEAARP